MRKFLVRHLWRALVLIIAIGRILPAQEPLITRETPVDTVTLDQWLHSGDPRLIAWAADFAQRTHDATILAEMTALLEQMPIPQAKGLDETRAAQRRAVLAILDAVIQQKMTLPITGVRAIAEDFPGPAAILAARLPLDQSRSMLEDWTLGATGTWGGRTLARVASMMLAKQVGPSAGIANERLAQFVISGVSASEEELQVTISSSPGGRGGGSSTCGDSLDGKPRTGWPVIFGYALVENDPATTEPVVIELDGDRIGVERIEVDRGWGTCFYVESLDATTRHRLIAHWLGVGEKDMSWQPVESFTIVWNNKAAYQRQLGKIIEAQRAKLHATGQALRQRGILTESEAAISAPRLIVTIRCEIEPCPLS